MGVFENRVLRRIFGPKRHEVTVEWRKLHNEELNHLYYSPNLIWVIKSGRMGWAGQVTRMCARTDAHRVLVGKPEGKRPLGRHRRKMDLQEVGWGGGAWTGLIWLRIGTGGSHL